MIALDATSPVPPFEQIRAQLAAQIRDESLPVGARLPTVRRLADDLGLAVNTVARAYRELESAGLVETRGRAGTTVRATTDARQALIEAATEFARAARRLGVTDEDAVRDVRTALAAIPAPSR